MNKTQKVRVLLILGATLLLGVPTALASGGLPKVPTYAGPVSKKDFQVRPARISFGMGEDFLAGPRKHNLKTKPLTWTSWTGSSARGSGLFWIDDCRPDCASGKYHSYPVKLKMSHPGKVSGYLLFTRMTLTYTGKRPPRTSHKQVYRVKHNKTVYFWTTTGS